MSLTDANKGLSGVNPIAAGSILVASDFPTLNEVVTSQSQYQVLASVTDNDPTRTNTGQSFVANDYIVWDGTNWNKIGGDGSDVESVFGRTGAVVSTNGDYTASQVTNVPSGSISATNVQAAIAELDAEKQTNVLTNGNIFVGNGSNVATSVAMSGDATIINTGAITISNLAVTNAKIANNTIDLTAKVTGVLPNANTTAEAFNGAGNTAFSIASRDSFGELAANSASSASIASQVGTGPSSSGTANSVAFLTDSGPSFQGVNTNPALLFNATTGALSATSFIGALTGNASTATALATGRTIAITGDLTYTSPSFDGSGNVTAAGTLATVNSNTGSFGSATQTGTFTVNGKGLITAASNATITPAVGSITGLGIGVATALGVNIGSGGAPVLFNGAGGTPSSIVLTNATGTASSLTAGVATLANTISTANEASDTTSFPLFVTASGTQSLQPKNNTSLTFNSSTAELGATSLLLGSGNKALSFGGSSPAVGSRKIELYRVTDNDHQVYAFGVDSSTLRYQIPASGDSHVFYSGINSTTSLELMRISGTGIVNIPGTTASTSTTTGCLTLAGGLGVAGAITGPYTAGSILFAGTGGVITQDNTGIFYDNTLNRLALGRTDPISTLEVVGPINATDGGAAATVKQLQISYDTVNNRGDISCIHQGTSYKDILFAAANILIGSAAIATNATDGFIKVPTCAGTPTGVPTAGNGCMVMDTTNNRLYIYSASAWRAAM